MANWQRELNIKESWLLAKEGTIVIQALAGEIAKKLKTMKPLNNEVIDHERLEIADEFLAISEDSEADTEAFDYTMERLYDWADTPLDERWNGKKACWVKILF